ncbi:MAG: amino acid permease [Candidatus Aminicenantes bacterium]|nr:amino acid permease [Candidatus Aminicenantes bacterium]
MSKKEKIGLVRQLGFFDSTMIMMGIVIGSGIFITTGIMAKNLPSAGLILLAWIAGGLLTLAGALTYAELGAAMPEAGGQYVYLREAYGPLPGFLFGWVLFLVYNTGGIAGLAAALAEYVGWFFPFLSTENIVLSAPINIFGWGFRYTLSMAQVVAAATIILLSLVNYVGVGPGKILQNIFTVVKIAILVLIIFFGFAFGKGQAVDLSLNPGGLNFGQLIAGFAAALVAVAWAFDGWNNVTFVAGEIKNPGRNLPKVLILGTLGITVLYVLINYIYLYALPIQEAAGVVRIAEKACNMLFSGAYAALIAGIVIVSIFGSINGSILAGPRVLYAMAKDRIFFQKAAEVHPRFRTPGIAILLQAVWATILALSGTFTQLLTFCMFAAIMFWIAAAAAVFTLRKKYPDLPRPYKTPGYPVVPALFILASAGILINTLLESPVESLAGIGITLLGIPVYYAWKKKNKNVSHG